MAQHQQIWREKPLGYRVDHDEARCIPCAVDDEADLETIAFGDSAAQHLRCGRCNARLTMYHERVNIWRDDAHYDQEFDLDASGYLGYRDYPTFYCTQLARQQDDLPLLLQNKDLGDTLFARVCTQSSNDHAWMYLYLRADWAEVAEHVREHPGQLAKPTPVYSYTDRPGRLTRTGTDYYLSRSIPVRARHAAARTMLAEHVDSHVVIHGLLVEWDYTDRRIAVVHAVDPRPANLDAAV